ncbi:hypothetical protein GGI25_005609 [Coemansia spiralis]|uniref:HMG box domain-containing protein n=2 Tax=Coemansia TaxID=4863 RepID=A0A9W8G2Y7_9FUNG|nr:hypothetical protein EDC05_004660 [Coemansia umbellata]KAJ2620167.1 hypothetical protein GGI26_005232 [Coemansia sp. RSA 1358]KAJ2671123.1 hypothetical protein GGI25_005609 [Coemansia spiralis]
MSTITLSSEDCEMIERCVDMISMQCKMIANMLRRSRASSGMQLGSHHDIVADGGDNMTDVLANAASTLGSAMRHMSGEANITSGDSQSATRKRPRSALHSAYMDFPDDHHSHADISAPLSTTPVPVKRRGRPPRDYGDELGPAFAMYASETYSKTEQELMDRMGGGSSGARVPKSDILSAVWESWWLSSQALKDKYLALSRQEMTINETHMLELLLDYPLPAEAVLQAGNRSGTSYGHSISPEPATPFDVFLSEQIPLLRSKVPDWSDAEITRRLTVNWNSMASVDREKYAAPTAQNVNSAQLSVYPAIAPATPMHTSAMSRGYPNSGGQRSGYRASGNSAPRRAYVLFCREERPLLVQENPTWDLPTVNKELGRRWKELAPEKKEVFHELERKESESRAIAAAAAGASPQNGSAYGVRGNGASSTGTYQRPGGYFSGTSSIPLASSVVRPTSNLGSPFQRAGGKPGTPGSGNPNKGPSKAYVLYSRVNRKGVTSEHPDWDLATINRELGRMWKVLPIEERQSWESRAIAAANGEPESVSSTPKRYASPSVPTAAAHVGTASTMTPSPIQSALALSGDNTNVSTPATPVSRVDTPTTKDGAAVPDHHEYDGESEAEDVEMQDDDADGRGYYTQLSSRAQGAADSFNSEPTNGHHNSASVNPPSAIATTTSTTAAAVTGPPPMAKPAAVMTNGSGNNHPVSGSANSTRISEPQHQSLHHHPIEVPRSNQ